MDIKEQDLQYVVVSPKEHPQAYKLDKDANLMLKFVNSSDHLYFQRFYVFDDGTIVLDEVSQGKTTIKSNKEIVVDGDVIRFV